MALAHPFLHGSPVESSLTILDQLFGPYPKADVQVRLWDGTLWSSARPPRCTLVLNHPGALRSMFAAPSELAFGEAYIYGDFDVEGDLEAAFELGDWLLHRDINFLQKLKLGTLLHALPSDGRWNGSGAHLRGRVHSTRRDRQAIHYHYDQPSEFYRLFLGDTMAYSCGFFENEADPLDRAQDQKFDYCCRKLRVKAGERLLDIGCGFAGLILHAAKKYGAQVVGITLSEEQAEVGRQRIREAGLQDHCRVELCDYRDVDPGGGFDKIVSIGMCEHVGREMLPRYFDRACEMLRAGGLFLNHGIAASAKFVRNGASFINSYVFPDGDLVPIHTMVEAAEGGGFEVRDVESLREHYALTLRHWVERLDERRDQARKYVDEVTYRIWRLYMAGSRHAFLTGRVNVYQSLLVKSGDGRSGMPLTRGELYSN